MAATELAQYGQFTIQHSSDSAFSSPTTLARVSSMTINDSFEVTPVDDFDAAIGTIIDQVLAGRSVNVSFEANLVLGDAGFQAVNADYKAGTYSYLGITMVDTETTTTTFTYQLGGYWSTRTMNGQKPVATVSLTFQASEILSDDVS